MPSATAARQGPGAFMDGVRRSEACLIRGLLWSLRGMRAAPLAQCKYTYFCMKSPPVVRSRLQRSVQVTRILPVRSAEFDPLLM